MTHKNTAYLNKNGFALSKFIKIIPCGNGDGLFLNTLYRSVVKVDSQVFSALLDPDKRHLLNSREINELLESKVLAFENDGEEEIFKNWIDGICGDTRNIRATICVTSRCNLDCPYCFENGYIKQDSSDLTSDSARRVINWLKNYAIENKSQSIHIYYYGGEPTLCPNTIAYLSKVSKKEFGCLGICTSYSMYTNGTNLNSVLLKTLKQFKFEQLQITLDGPPEVHDKRRPFKNGRGSFDVIFSNVIKILAETKIKVLLLVNFDEENYRLVPDMLDKFVDLDVSKRVEFAFNPVFRTDTNTAYCDCYSLTDQNSFKVWRELYLSASQKGLYSEPFKVFNKGPCSFLRKSHLIFSPNGEIYKCIGFLGKRELSVGHINDDFSTTCKKIDTQVHMNVWENDHCRSCEFLPLCLGGCRFQSLVESGDIRKPICHKQLIENVEFKLMKEMAISKEDL